MRRTLLLVLTMGMLLSGCGDRYSYSEGGTTPGSSGRHSTRDVLFLRTMIVRHNAAIELASLVKDRGASAQVTKMAQDITSWQTYNLTLMRGWLKDWHEPQTAPAARDQPGLPSAKAVAALKTLTGNDFDRRWTTLMIALDSESIDIAQDGLGEGTDPDVQQLAFNMINALSTQLTQMKGWE